MPSCYLPWILGLVVGCVRAPAEALCPSLSPGELAITEVRGPGRNGAASPWIEVRAERELDLLGLRVRIRRPDGGAEHVALVRSSVRVSAGGHAVLAVAALEGVQGAYVFDEALPWLPTAALQLESCEVMVDRMFHPVLPEEGTYSLGPAVGGLGAAVHNDRAAAWCVDTLGSGASVGTPGQENRPCL